MLSETWQKMNYTGSRRREGVCVEVIRHVCSFEVLFQIIKCPSSMLQYCKISHWLLFIVPLFFDTIGSRGFPWDSCFQFAVSINFTVVVKLSKPWWCYTNQFCLPPQTLRYGRLGFHLWIRSRLTFRGLYIQQVHPIHFSLYLKHLNSDVIDESLFQNLLVFALRRSYVRGAEASEFSQVYVYLCIFI